jgi:hypothetical protein
MGRILLQLCESQALLRNNQAHIKPIADILTTMRLAEFQLPENSTTELTIIGPMVWPIPAPCNINPAINAMCEGLIE